MSKAERIANSLSMWVADVASLLKVALKSKHAEHQKSCNPEREIFILGNGPSLREVIDNYGEQLAQKELMAVNFFANTPSFSELKPRHYILADKHFFEGVASDKNVSRLWENLNGATWPITLYVPTSQSELVANLFKGELRLFNDTPIEGHELVVHKMIGRGWGMPRPRNVMIPAVMTSVIAGYGKIYLLGADHSWSRTLSVDNQNRVLSRQPHFYADNKEELDRVAEEYKGYHLHDILNSLTIAFRSYHEIKSYTERIGAKIINLTAGSMIDAFERGALENVLQE